MVVSFKGAHFPQELILTCIRWYVAYPLSTRHVEELMRERGVSVDHATVNRWVIKYSPPLEAAFHRQSGAQSQPHHDSGADRRPHRLPHRRPGESGGPESVLSDFAPSWLFGVGCETVVLSRGE